MLLFLVVAGSERGRACLRREKLNLNLAKNIRGKRKGPEGPYGIIRKI